jgi:hypothetical protein
MRIGFLLGVLAMFLIVVSGTKKLEYKMLCREFDGNDLCTVTHRIDKKFKHEFVRGVK